MGTLDYRTPEPPPEQRRTRAPPPPEGNQRPGVTRTIIGALLTVAGAVLMKHKGSGWENACPSTMMTLGLPLLIWGIVALVRSGRKPS